jgi:integrase
MATMAQIPGGWKIRFKLDRDTRRTVRLGAMPAHKAQTFKEHIERLVMAHRGSIQEEPKDARWLAGLNDETHEKLSRTGLVEPRKSSQAITIGELVNEFTTKRNDVKQSTRLAWKQGHDCLIAFVGADRPVDRITENDADDWRQDMIAAGVKEVTIRKRVKVCKTLLTWAVRRGYLDKSPLTQLASASQAGQQKPYVSVETALQVIDKLPDHRWRLLFALGRFGGLRLPSEALALQWDDVDFERDRITVPVPKLEHIPGKETRQIPIFEKLQPYLLTAYEELEPGESRVVALPKVTDAYLRKVARQAIQAAKVKPWRCVFHALRASCETDLMKEHPIHVVARWIGHDLRVAEKHYLQVTDEDFARAAGVARTTKRTTISENGEEPERMGEPKRGFSRPIAPTRSGSDGKVGDTGLEPVTSCLSSRRSSQLS